MKHGWLSTIGLAEPAGQEVGAGLVARDPGAIYRMRVSEIFGPTIQGEGAQIGRPTVFVRFGGCDYRCSWCDSMYAVLPEYRHTWKQMTATEILNEVERLSKGRVLITLSGGNPAIWNLEELIELGHKDGHEFTMETQGSVSKPWFSELDYLCISPKPPSSGMETDMGQLQACLEFCTETSVILKIVIFDDADFAYARDIADRFPGIRPIYLQVGNRNPTGETDTGELLAALERLSVRVIAEQWYDVRVLPQLHTLMWGNKRAV